MKHAHTWKVALLGLAGLAAAMGIGRFAFTPILPLMQASNGMTLVQGSWLASINYLGYFIGALACIWLAPRPASWAKIGLLTVALVTLAMAIPAQPFALWLLWRLLAGIASALVLVGLSAWCLGRLAQSNAGHLAGLMYAGVGIGVAFAGLAGLGAGVAALDPLWLWALLGLVALSVWLWAQPQLQTDTAESQQLASQKVASATGDRSSTQTNSQPFTADHWWLIGCYGIFGIGYILPATFLPAMARQVLPDPSIYGWIWPAFGTAAALSTLLVSRFFHALPPRRVWALAAIVMAVGVALPVLAHGLVALLLAALCVGGTFMVMTMAGMQEARAAGGATLIAAMTASFAAGQMAGPLLLNLTHGGLLWPSLGGAIALLLSAVALLSRKV